MTHEETALSPPIETQLIDRAMDGGVSGVTVVIVWLLIKGIPGKVGDAFNAWLEHQKSAHRERCEIEKERTEAFVSWSGSFDKITAKMCEQQKDHVDQEKVVAKNIENIERSVRHAVGNLAPIRRITE